MRVPVSLLGIKGIAVPLGLFSSSSTSSVDLLACSSLQNQNALDLLECQATKSDFNTQAFASQIEGSISISGTNLMPNALHIEYNCRSPFLWSITRNCLASLRTRVYTPLALSTGRLLFKRALPGHPDRQIQWPKGKCEAAKGEKVWERLQNGKKDFQKTQNHLGGCNIQFSHACRPRTRSSRQRPCDLKTWCKAASSRRIQQKDIAEVLREGVMFLSRFSEDSNDVFRNLRRRSASQLPFQRTWQSCLWLSETPRSVPRSSVLRPVPRLSLSCLPSNIAWHIMTHHDTFKNVWKVTMPRVRAQCVHRWRLSASVFTRFSHASWRLELYAARKVAFARSPHNAMAKILTERMPFNAIRYGAVLWRCDCWRYFVIVKICDCCDTVIWSHDHYGFIAAAKLPLMTLRTGSQYFLLCLWQLLRVRFSAKVSSTNAAMLGSNTNSLSWSKKHVKKTGGTYKAGTTASQCRYSIFGAGNNMFPCVSFVFLDLLNLLGTSWHTNGVKSTLETACSASMIQSIGNVQQVTCKWNIITWIRGNLCS